MTAETVIEMARKTETEMIRRRGQDLAAETETEIEMVRERRISIKREANQNPKRTMITVD